MNILFIGSAQETTIANMSIMLVCLACLVAGLVALFGHLYARFRSPVAVNCWFCNADAKVSRDKRNSFICSNCKQYNGFTKNGDYNKEIPEQYYSHLNQGIIEDRKQEFNTGGDILCNSCQHNQYLKIRQLADFQPFDEKSWEAELEAYQQHLEHVYKLCPPCDRVLMHTLNMQNSRLTKLSSGFQRKRMDENFAVTPSGESENLSWQVHTPYIIHFAHVVSLVSAVVCLLTFLFKVLDGSSLIKPNSVEYNFTVLRPFLNPISESHLLVSSFAAVACTCATFYTGYSRLLLRDVFLLLVWASLLFCQFDLLLIDQYMQALLMLLAAFTSWFCAYVPRIGKSHHKKPISIVKVRKTSVNNCSDLSETSSTLIKSNSDVSVSPIYSRIIGTSPVCSSSFPGHYTKSISPNDKTNDSPRKKLGGFYSHPLEHSKSEKEFLQNREAHSLLETISIGSASQHRKDKPDVFTQYIPPPSPPQQSPILSWLNQCKPIIAPARFIHSSPPQEPHWNSLPGRGKNVWHQIDAKSNSSYSHLRNNALFSSPKFGSTVPLTEDRSSVFSEFRESHANDSDEDITDAFSMNKPMPDNAIKLKSKFDISQKTKHATTKYPSYTNSISLSWKKVVLVNAICNVILFTFYKLYLWFL